MLELSKKKLDLVAQDGHLLVLGGPGSGKTTVAIVKADKLVSTALRSAQRILFLSFARATIARVSEALDEHSTNRRQTRKQVCIETYHAFFWRLIKTHGYLLELPRKLEVLTPPAQAIALAQIRRSFGPVKKLDQTGLAAKRGAELAELQRLTHEEGRVSFDLFSEYAASLLEGSLKIRALLSSAHPFIILDEFQDTSGGQWRVVEQLGIGSTLLALADQEQRIYGFAGADPARLDHFRKVFKPTEFDFSDESHRSPGTDIGRFGNDVVKGVFTGPYTGIRVASYAANQNQGLATLKGQALQARKRLIALDKKDWSLAILVPTKKMMRQVSDNFRAAQTSLPEIRHVAALDMAGVILAAEVISSLLRTSSQKGYYESFVGLMCNYFRGRGGDTPSNTDIAEADGILAAHAKAVASASGGPKVHAKSIIHPIKAGYDKCVEIKLTGDPEQDWAEVRKALEECGCKRLGEIAEDARNVRLLDRGTQLREALSLDWRENGSYPNALDIVRQAFVQEHFSSFAKKESGVVVMNMHKAKGKQFDEVIIFEGWPRMQKGQIVSNSDRICRGNDAGKVDMQDRYNFRVSVTRARIQTTIMTPATDPCVLLKGFKST